MVKIMLRAAIVAGLLSTSFGAQPAMAQRGVNATAAPSAGTAQRRAILDALRPAIQRTLGPNIEFVVQRMAVRNGWALVVADPRRRGGARINPRQYFTAEQIETMDPGLSVQAIMRFRGGRWTVHDHAIGPTDVWYCGVDAAPRALTGC